MNVMNLYCKANKRKRDGKAVGAYAYILKDEIEYKEEVHLLEEETRVARLELLALNAGLRALKETHQLENAGCIQIYVSNEYILEELLKAVKDKVAGRTLNFNKGEEYTDLWEEVELLLNLCQAYTVTGLNKKDRGEGEEEIKRHMGMLNKVVCDEVNHYFRANSTIC